MTTDTGGVVKVIGYEKLLKKLGGVYLLGDTIANFLKAAAESGAANLRSRIPDGPKHASELVSYQAEMTSAKVLAPANPLIFLERGAQYPSAGRAHVRRRGVRSGDLRVAARHWLGKTMAWIRAQLNNKLIPDAIKDVERKWSE